MIGINGLFGGVLMKCLSPPSRRFDRRSRIALPIAIWLVLQFPASAADINVGSGCTLVDAIIAANTDSASGLCPAGVGSDRLILTGDVTLIGIKQRNRPQRSPSGDQQHHDSGERLRGYALQRICVSDLHPRRGHSGAREYARLATAGEGGPPYDWGGGIYAFGGSLTLTDSTVADCEAYTGGGINATGGTSLSLINSTVSGNHAITTGGGIGGEGSSTSLVNSTISGNTAGYGYGGGIATNFGSVSITSSTLSGNSGAISGNAMVTGSVIAKSGGVDNCSGSITNLGGNRSDDSTCGTIPTGLSLLDPILADNGGPTKTHKLLMGSNAINNAGTCGLPTDQRGLPRDDGACDSGAFEYSSPLCNLLELKDDTITEAETHECTEIHLGPNFSVAGPNGSLTATAETQVVFFNGVSVTIDGELIAGIDPIP